MKEHKILRTIYKGRRAIATVPLTALVAYGAISYSADVARDVAENPVETRNNVYGVMTDLGGTLQSGVNWVNEFFNGDSASESLTGSEDFIRSSGFIDLVPGYLQHGFACNTILEVTIDTNNDLESPYSKIDDTVYSAAAAISRDEAVTAEVTKDVGIYYNGEVVRACAD